MRRAEMCFVASNPNLMLGLRVFRERERPARVVPGGASLAGFSRLGACHWGATR